MAIGDFPVGGVASAGAFDLNVAPPVYPTTLSVGPGRLLGAPVGMQPFRQIYAGEIDNFAFDFGPEVGAEQVGYVLWFCRTTPFSAGADSTPQSRVPAGFIPPISIIYRRTNNGILLRQEGFFAAAPVGPMPVSAAGGDYVLGATAYLDGGTRQVTLWSTLHCSLPGLFN